MAFLVFSSTNYSVLGTFRNDWAKAGFGIDLVTISRTENFYIDYRQAGRYPIGSPLRLAQQLAEEISQFGTPTVIVSGGIDSQAMAYAFHTAKVKARYVQISYDGLNEHDLAGDFYTNTGIALERINLDVRGFHESDELLHLAKRYQIASPHILTHCKICEMVDGVIVSGGAPINVDVGRMNFSTFGLSRYAAIEQRPMVPFFFNYCPSLLRSISGELRYLDPYSHKTKLYREAGFPVEPQSMKLHGFERLKEYYDGATITPQQRLRYGDRASKRPYDVLFRYPLVDAVPYRDSGFTLDWRDSS